MKKTRETENITHHRHEVQVQPIAPEVARRLPDQIGDFMQGSVDRLKEALTSQSTKRGLTFRRVEQGQALQEIERSIDSIVRDAATLIRHDEIAWVARDMLKLQQALTKLLVKASLASGGDPAKAVWSLEDVFNTIKAGPTRYDRATEVASKALVPALSHPTEHKIAKFHRLPENQKNAALALSAGIDPKAYQQTQALKRFFQIELFGRLSPLADYTLIALHNMKGRFSEIQSAVNETSGFIEQYQKSPRLERLRRIALESDDIINGTKVIRADQEHRLDNLGRDPLSADSVTEDEIWNTTQSNASAHQNLRTSRIVLAETAAALLAAMATTDSGQEHLTREVGVITTASMQAGEIVRVGLGLEELVRAAVAETEEGPAAGQRIRYESPILNS